MGVIEASRWIEKLQPYSYDRTKSKDSLLKASVVPALCCSPLAFTAFGI